MTDPIRDAAKAMLDAHYHDGDVGAAAARLLAALAAPEPAADERVREHMRLADRYAGLNAMLAKERTEAARSLVESSAHALLAAGLEDVALLVHMNPRTFEQFKKAVAAA